VLKNSTVINRTRSLGRSISKHWRANQGEHQNVGIYSDPKFAEGLETWGAGTAWTEIQFLIGGRKGRVLDVACGTGRTHDFLSHFTDISYFGCDISQMLIDKAIERGISAQNVSVQDATKMSYSDRSFDYVYSIGSLEHFTVDGLLSTLRECNRICTGLNFHHLPVSKSSLNEGWISPYQSYWNNSKSWWLSKFKAEFGEKVWTIDSAWQDGMSKGVWFVCGREDWFHRS
jgi:SAM-dependent methyltransferase